MVDSNRLRRGFHTLSLKVHAVWRNLPHARRNKQNYPSQALEVEIGICAYKVTAVRSSANGFFTSRFRLCLYPHPTPPRKRKERRMAIRDLFVLHYDATSDTSTQRLRNYDRPPTNCPIASEFQQHSLTMQQLSYGRGQLPATDLADLKANNSISQPWLNASPPIRRTSLSDQTYALKAQINGLEGERESAMVFPRRRRRRMESGQGKQGQERSGCTSDDEEYSVKQT
ncbi:hypothetical protein BKA70DRAFT_1440699 [Coprinopsis sp. MPI-PUGE-AT-0042]|nr:hypothetical protein BKA70DRAFT_1440699 [Coprinopsis sp. MPI-PUGE-AT-0042]